MRIVGCGEGNVTPRADKESLKPYVDLENDAGEKFRRTLNGQNVEKIVELYGEESDDCIGRDIGVRWDPEITYDREKTGGIEFVAPEEIQPATVESAREKSTLILKRRAPDELTLKRKQTQPQQANDETNDDDLPF
jgi:hypothetical protein